MTTEGRWRTHGRGTRNAWVSSSHANKATVRAYAWRRGPDMADDVVAETFTMAWQHLDAVPDEPLPWLA